MKNLLIAILLVFGCLEASAQRFVRSANTIAQLLSLNMNDPNTNYFVANRATANDGGGGNFVYDANSSVATNWGTVFKPTSYNGRLLRTFSGPLDVRWFGAVSGASDSSTPIQAALTVVSNANGGSIFIPRGSWIVNSLVGCSNLVMFGENAGSILKQKSAAQYVLSFNQDSGGTTNVTGNIRSVTLRNLMFEGRASEDGFSENRHLLNLNAVSDVVVDNCIFKGPQGDGIYVGSGNTPSTERHNETITIQNSVFDGVNSSNRNGISVIDCNRLTIQNNLFTRLSGATMPGGIDIESDSSYSITRSILITGNRFQDLTNSPAIIAFVNTTNMFDIHIVGNVISNCSRGIQWIGTATPSTTNIPVGLIISGNVIRGISGYGPLQVLGIDGYVIKDNLVTECQAGAAIDFARNGLVVGNTFHKIGQSHGGSPFGLSLKNVYGINLTANTFIDTGPTNLAGGWGLLFQDTSTSSNVTLIANSFSAPQGIMTVAIGKGAAHTFNKSSNWESGTRTNGATGNGFQSRNIGTGTPESAVVAGIGEIYQRRDGGANTTLYVKESTTGSTGWVAK